MPTKKSQLYGSIWESCDKLRGGMNAFQYKDYVLVLLFVKYVSDSYAGDPDALIAGVGAWQQESFPDWLKHLLDWYPDLGKKFIWREIE
jgi:type I restriction-modification system DNA methylase subunit